MLRFLSRRKVRNASSDGSSQIKSQRITTNKNKIDCRVILLDNTDLSIEIPVSLLQLGGQCSCAGLPFMCKCFTAASNRFVNKSRGQFVRFDVSRGPSRARAVAPIGIWLTWCLAYIRHVRARRQR